MFLIRELPWILVDRHGRLRQLQNIRDPANVVMVPVGDYNVLQLTVARCLPGLCPAHLHATRLPGQQPRQVVCVLRHAALARVDQEAAGPRAHEVGVRPL